MSLSILTNISAIDTNRNLQNSSNAVSKAMQDLSSGLRINTAADDASGYAVSQGMTDQVNGYNQASQNIGDATNMVQTADTALNNIQSMLQRVYELGVQYQNGDLSGTDKNAIQAEVNQLTDEIDRQTNSVQFNGSQLLAGKAGGTSGNNGTGLVTFQVGANAGGSNQLTATFSAIEVNGDATANSTTVLGNVGFDWTKVGTAQNSIVIDLSAATALTSISNAVVEEAISIDPGWVCVPSNPHRNPSTTPVMGFRPYSVRHGWCSRLLG